MKAPEFKDIEYMKNHLKWLLSEKKGWPQIWSGSCSSISIHLHPHSCTTCVSAYMGLVVKPFAVHKR